MINSQEKTGLYPMRILLSCMVITLHFLHFADALPAEGTSLHALRLIGALLEALCLVAVNAWVLLSGYLRRDKPFRLRGFAELVCTALFYALGVRLTFLAVAPAAGMTAFSSDGSFFQALQNLFPLSSGAWWFLSAYALLYLLMPFLNAGAGALSLRSFSGLLLLLCLFLSGIKSLLPVNLATDDMGYGIAWFLFLYLTGVYLRRREEEKGLPGLRAGLSLYLASTLCNFLLMLLFREIVRQTGHFTYYAGVMMHYNYFPNLTGALGLFLCFRALSLREGPLPAVTKRLSAHTLGVYLLHMHALIASFWQEAILLHTERFLLRESLVRFLLYLAATVLFWFAAGCLADTLRAMLFRLVPAGKKEDAP